MDERLRRQWAASEAQSFGRGGVSAVSRATGMSRNTVRRGMAETALRKAKPKAPVSTRIRSAVRPAPRQFRRRGDPAEGL
jgi:hypothetical protein